MPWAKLLFVNLGKGCVNCERFVLALIGRSGLRMGRCPSIGHLKPSPYPSRCQYSPAMTLIFGAVWQWREP